MVRAMVRGRIRIKGSLTNMTNSPVAGIILYV